MLGRLVRRGGVPRARREPLRRGPAPRAARARGRRLVEQVGEVGIGVDEADDGAGHVDSTRGAHVRRSDVGTPTRTPDPRCPTYRAGRSLSTNRKGGTLLWLIIGIVLLIIAIAGGVIVHPLLFALAILALLVFFVGGALCEIGGRALATFPGSPCAARSTSTPSMLSTRRSTRTIRETAGAFVVDL